MDPLTAIMVASGEALKVTQMGLGLITTGFNAVIEKNKFNRQVLQADKEIAQNKDLALYESALQKQKQDTLILAGITVVIIILLIFIINKKSK